MKYISVIMLFSIKALASPTTLLCTNKANTFASVMSLDYENKTIIVNDKEKYLIKGLQGSYIIAHSEFNKFQVASGTVLLMNRAGGDFTATRIFQSFDKNGVKHVLFEGNCQKAIQD